jgi:hypothetical protein
MIKVLELLSNAPNKGTLLELIVEDIFNDLGFSNVRRQGGGSQYGYDVIAYKDNQCWKAECKNLNQDVGVKEIAPKLAWHFNGISIDRFVIVSINPISNDLQYLLERRMFSFAIEIWSGNYLAKLICESPKACERLKIESLLNVNISDATQIVFPANDLKFYVNYSSGLPFSFDYFLIDKKLIKAYSEVDFRLTAVISNHTNRTIAVHSIKAKTLRFEKTDGSRILRQFKQKGNIKPLKLTFIPKQYPEGEVELNADRILEIKNNSTEYIEFKLSNKCQPGYYELLFEINCVEEGSQFLLYSSIFQLHKMSLKNDSVNLCVVGKYYDSPVEEILRLNNSTWMNIKREYSNGIKYLGPTIIDVVENKVKPLTWSVNLLQGKRSKADGSYFLNINSTSRPKLVIDLKIPIEEHIYTREDAFREIGIG